MKVAISGATGLIGSALRKSFEEDGAEILTLSRRKSVDSLETVTWDIDAGRFDPGPLEGIDAVVHLAGEPVAQRWTEARKKAIRGSRVEGTRLLVEGLKSLSKRPRVLVSSSGVDFYGDGGDAVLEESSPPGEGFLAEVCQAWEQAALGATELGIRTAVIRTGVVLSTRGGALVKMLPPFKLGLGGPVGSGEQWMPWIHIDDIVGVMRFVIEKEELSGAVNGTAPNPVRNREFAKTLGSVLNRPAFLPAPGFALGLAFGEMSRMLLDGHRTVPSKLEEAGYTFRYPELDKALEDVVRNRK